MNRIRVRAVVSGLVQGVFYRASTVDAARARNLIGWVQNRADGSVELEAEGPEEAVQDLVAWCRVGPPAARVDAVAVEMVACVGGDGFEVRR
jgi:acylphosphatase